jgi:hypothetical protein
MMDTARRVDAARARLAALKADAERAGMVVANLGPPCCKCRHFEKRIFGDKCTNPVNHSVKIEKFDVVVGGNSDAEAMRAADGLCGPEAILFELPPLVKRTPWHLTAGAVVFAAALAAGFLITPPLWAFCGLGVFVAVGEWVVGKWS